MADLSGPLRVDRYETGPGGTRSRIHGLGLELYGIEQPWRDNAPFRSCVPPGVYVALPHDSPTHGRCLALVGGTVCLGRDLLHPPAVARYDCLVHAANWADQLQGCIAPGTGESETDRGPMVTHSRDAMDLLLARVTAPVQVVVRGPEPALLGPPWGAVEAEEPAGAEEPHQGGIASEAPARARRGPLARLLGAVLRRI